MKILPTIYQNKAKVPGKNVQVPGFIVRKGKFYELCTRYSGAWLGMFWKVAQSRQKCRSPWLANEENFGL